MQIKALHFGEMKGKAYIQPGYLPRNHSKQAPTHLLINFEVQTMTYLDLLIGPPARDFCPKLAKPFDADEYFASSFITNCSWKHLLNPNLWSLETNTFEAKSYYLEFPNQKTIENRPPKQTPQLKEKKKEERAKEKVSALSSVEKKYC